MKDDLFVLNYVNITVPNISEFLKYVKKLVKSMFSANSRLNSYFIRPVSKRKVQKNCKALMEMSHKKRVLVSRNTTTKAISKTVL